MEIVQSYYLKSHISTTHNCLFLQIKSPLGFPMIEVFAHLKRIAKNRWHKAIKMYVVHFRHSWVTNFFSLSSFVQLSVYSIVTAFLLLISSALVIDNAVFYRRHEDKWNGSFNRICEHAKCGNVEAAGVSSKHCYFHFIVSCKKQRRLKMILHYFMWILGKNYNI